MARTIHEFRSPRRFVAGTVGQPGDRTFYIQVSQDSRLMSVELEKQQVLMAEVERLSACWALANPWCLTTLAKIRNSFRSGKALAINNSLSTVGAGLLAIQAMMKDESLPLSV